MTSSAQSAALAALLRHSMLRDACASVALSHEPDCGCVTCRAASGDKLALALVYDALRDWWWPT